MKQATRSSSPALTIHQALPNYTEDKLRLSLDNRYMLVGDKVAEHMLHAARSQPAHLGGYLSALAA